MSGNAATIGVYRAPSIGGTSRSRTTAVGIDEPPLHPALFNRRRDAFEAAKIRHPLRGARTAAVDGAASKLGGGQRADEGPSQGERRRRNDRLHEAAPFGEANSGSAFRDGLRLAGCMLPLDVPEITPGVHVMCVGRRNSGCRFVTARRISGLRRVFTSASRWTEAELGEAAGSPRHQPRRERRHCPHRRGAGGDRRGGGPAAADAETGDGLGGSGPGGAWRAPRIPRILTGWRRPW